MDSETIAEMCKAHEFILKARPDAVDVAVPVADMTALLTAAKLSEARGQVVQAVRNGISAMGRGDTASCRMYEADVRHYLAALAAAEKEPT